MSLLEAVRPDSTSLRVPRTLRGALPLALGLVCLLLGAAAYADEHEDATDQALVKYRQSLMSAIGANMGAAGDILKNQLALPGHVESHARQMAESARLIAAAFETRTSFSETDAKERIWKEWSKFEEAIANFEKAALELQSAAASGDPAAVGPAMRGLGKSCGGCHKPFRKPKEESFKNR